MSGAFTDMVSDVILPLSLAREYDAELPQNDSFQFDLFNQFQ